MSEESKYTGKISFLSDKGFGFIDAGNGKSVFFHASSCNGIEYAQLYKGVEVIFSNVEENAKGFSAKCVELK